MTHAVADPLVLPRQRERARRVGVAPERAVERHESVAEMGSNQIGDIPVTRMLTVDPGSSRDTEFFPGMPKRWGLGYMISTEATPTGRSAGSGAWAGLANTYFWLDPTRQLTGLILTQILPFGDPAVLGTFERFEQAIYDVV